LIEKLLRSFFDAVSDKIKLSSDYVYKESALGISDKSEYSDDEKIPDRRIVSPQKLESDIRIRNLTKKFVIYYVVANDNLTSRDDTRPAGENLAHDFIVPNIKADNPFVVIDVHEIDPKYEYSNFIYSISNNSAKSNEYSHIIADNLSIENFNFTEGTSPHKVTEPIAAQGINTLLMETCITNSLQEKHNTAEKLIYTLDNLKK